LQKSASLAVTQAVRASLVSSWITLLATLSCGRNATSVGHVHDPRSMTAVVSPKPNANRIGPPVPSSESTDTSELPPAALVVAAATGQRTSELRVPCRDNAALEIVGATGQWLAYCEASGVGGETLRLARRKLGPSDAAPSSADALVEDVDAVLAASPGGRYLVVQSNERAWLLDTKREARFDLAPLDPDLRADGLPDHRSFSFSADERELAVLGPSGRRGRVVDLAALGDGRGADWARVAREVEWDGEAWRIRFEGAVLVVQLARTRGSKNVWPVRASAAPLRRCQLRGERFAAFAALSAPDAAYAQTVRLVEPGQARGLEAPGFVYSLGTSWLRREDDGRLVLVKGAVQKQVASSRCGARVLHADPKRELFLVACEQYRPTPAPDAPTKKKGARPPSTPTRFPLYLVGPGSVVDLEADTLRTGIDAAPDFSSPRFVPVRPGAETALLDLEARRLIRLGADAVVLGTAGTTALVRRGSRLLAFGPAGEAPLTLRWTAFSSTGVGGGTFFHGGAWGGWDRPLCSLPEGSVPVELTTHGALVVREVQAGQSTAKTFRVLPPCGLTDPL